MKICACPRMKLLMTFLVLFCDLFITMIVLIGKYIPIHEGVLFWYCVSNCTVCRDATFNSIFSCEKFRIHICIMKQKTCVKYLYQ